MKSNKLRDKKLKYKKKKKISEMLQKKRESEKTKLKN
jgi:hypothetical protein